MTKTFGNNCDINIVQQTSCEPLFPNVQIEYKMYFFFAFVRPCMHHNYGVISGSHACRDCVAYNLVCRDLYNLPWRVSVSSHHVQCNNPTFEALLQKNTYLSLFLGRCRKYSHTTWPQFGGGHVPRVPPTFLDEGT